MGTTEESKKDTVIKRSPEKGIPGMLRANSMKNISLPHNLYKRRCYHGGSETRDPNQDDVQQHLDKGENNNVGGNYFPTIQGSGTATISTKDKDTNEVNFSLPHVRAECTGHLQNKTVREFKKKNSTEGSRFISKIVPCRLEKWFLEIPEAEFEKAGKVWKEVGYTKSFRKNHQRGSNTKTIKVPNLKPLQNIPSQYLELRTDHCDLNRDVRINRGHYKLKQKSLLQLKMIDIGERDKIHRTNTDYDFDARPYASNAERAHTQENRPTLKDFVVTENIGGDGMKIINIGEFAIDAFSNNPNSKFSFVNQQRGITNHMNGTSFSDVKSMDEPVTYKNGKLDTKTTVVNIEIEKRRSTENGTGSTNLGTNRLQFDYSHERKEDETSAGSLGSQKGLNRPKSALKTFKQIEVFSNGKKASQLPTTLPDNPLYKLDLKATPVKHIDDNLDSDSDHGVPKLSFNFRKDDDLLERAKHSVFAVSNVSKTKLARLDVSSSKQTLQASKVTLHTRKSNVPVPVGITKTTCEDVQKFSHCSNQFSDNTYTMTPDFQNTPDLEVVQPPPQNLLNDTDDTPAPPPTRQPMEGCKETFDEEIKPNTLQKENTRDIATSVSSLGEMESHKGCVRANTDVTRDQKKDTFPQVTTNNAVDELVKETREADERMSDEIRMSLAEEDDITKVQLSNFVEN